MVKIKIIRSFTTKDLFYVIQWIVYPSFRPNKKFNLEAEKRP